MKFATKAIHAGVHPDEATGAIMTPIYQTSTYIQDGVGGHKGYEYSRTLNPTRHALEKNIAAIENARFGAAFGSGLAAIDCVVKMLNPGDEVIQLMIYMVVHTVYLQRFLLNMELSFIL